MQAYRHTLAEIKAARKIEDDREAIRRKGLGRVAVDKIHAHLDGGAIHWPDDFDFDAGREFNAKRHRAQHYLNHPDQAFPASLRREVIAILADVAAMPMPLPDQWRAETDAIHAKRACIRPDVQGFGMVEGLTDTEREIVLDAMNDARELAARRYPDDHGFGRVESAGLKAASIALRLCLAVRSRSAPWTWDHLARTLDDGRAATVAAPWDDFGPRERAEMGSCVGHPA